MKKTTLLDTLADRMGCVFLSDLRFLPEEKRGRLAREVGSILPHQAPVSEWNDALSYLTGAGPEPTAEVARARLSALLLGCCGARQGEKMQEGSAGVGILDDDKRQPGQFDRTD